MSPLWLLRMARWARRPPSRRRVLLVLAVVGASLALVAVERVAGWPEALTVDGFGRAGRP
ncbi:hypothetical protein ORIO_05070 [Cereibacter azotoformans]|uniref:hypothetical protein n=1 Tax=Cereibacter azotoformans TaxID=43057 RepID=UPI000321B870|nr:hypothetical protein [Cereibacter azotoformans]ULB09295.1 hypothetical protein ORIO_05070 [Cereibacter azotoformans]